MKFEYFLSANIEISLAISFSNYWIVINLSAVAVRRTYGDPAIQKIFKTLESSQHSSV